MTLRELIKGDKAHITIEVTFEGIDGDGDYEFSGEGLSSTLYVRNEPKLVSVEKLVPPLTTGDIVRHKASNAIFVLLREDNETHCFKTFDYMNVGQDRGDFGYAGSFPDANYDVIGRVGEGKVAA